MYCKKTDEAFLNEKIMNFMNIESKFLCFTQFGHKMP